MVELSPPDWLGVPVCGDAGDLLFDFKIDPDIDGNFKQLIPDAKRRHGLLRHVFLLIAYDSIPQNDFERVLGHGSVECTPREQAVWMQLVHSLSMTRSSHTAQLRLLRLLEHPERFKFNILEDKLP